MLLFFALFKQPKKKKKKELFTATWNFFLDSFFVPVLCSPWVAQTNKFFQVDILPIKKESMEHIFLLVKSIILNV